MTKHEAMAAFFSPKLAEISANMNFNFSDDSPDSIGFLTNYADKTVKKYVRVGAVKEYGFTIIATKTYSQYEDDINLEAMQFVQNLMDWVDSKNKAKEFPEFPENCQIQKIEALQNMPSVAGVNLDQNLARYSFQCRVVYFEKEV